MYFKNIDELKNIVPYKNGQWNKEYLIEYLIQSCNLNFKEYTNQFFEKYQSDYELADMLFDILLDDNMDGSDSQMGAAYYISKLDHEILSAKKNLLILAQQNQVQWKRPFQDESYLKFLN